MRTLTATLSLAQKTGGATLTKIVLTKGVNTYTYDILYATNLVTNQLQRTVWTEKGELQEATVLLDNRNGLLDDIDFKAYQGDIYSGAKGTGGNEYSQKAPLWVDYPHQVTNVRGKSLYVQLHLKGIFNWMEDDEASADYTLAVGDGQTAKTLMKKLAGGGGLLPPCYSHCVAYTIDWDDEDSLADVVCPANSFRIKKGDNRYAKMKELLSYFDGAMRVENDGHIHIFRPDLANYTFESYTAGDDANVETASNVWRFESFTPQKSGLRNSVKLLLYRTGSPGTVTVSVRATNAVTGLPTGADLCVGTTDGDTLATGSPYTLREITFTTPLYELRDTKYAYCIRALTADGTTNILHVRSDESSPTYTRGNAGASVNSGVAWTDLPGTCFIFYDIGYKDSYKYDLAAGSHPFFNKGYQTRLINPNRIIVSSPPDEATIYTGTATDTTDNALRDILKSYEFHVASNAQAASVATAILKRSQREAESGYGSVPPNVGQEMYDYVAIVDLFDGQTRYGNVGYIREEIGLKERGTYISFGKPMLGGNLGLTGQEGEESVGSLKSRIDEIWEVLGDVLAGSKEKGVWINTSQLISGDHHLEKRGTWTANSPGAGRVAWAGVTLVYKGVTYTITDSNTPLTTDKYIWWDYSVSTTVLQVSATRPTLTDDDCLIAINDGGTPYLQTLETLIHGNVIRTGTVIADTLVATLVLSTTIVAGTLGGDRVELSSAGIKMIGDTIFKMVSSAGTYEAIIYVSDAGDIALLPSSGTSYVVALGPLSIGASKNFGMLMSSGANVEAIWFDDGSFDYAFRPLTDNKDSFGIATKRWKNVFCTTLGSGAVQVITAFIATLGSATYPANVFVNDVYPEGTPAGEAGMNLSIDVDSNDGLNTVTLKFRHGILYDYDIV